MREVTFEHVDSIFGIRTGFQSYAELNSEELIWEAYERQMGFNRGPLEMSPRGYRIHDEKWYNNGRGYGFCWTLWIEPSEFVPSAFVAFWD